MEIQFNIKGCEIEIGSQLEIKVDLENKFLFLRADDHETCCNDLDCNCGNIRIEIKDKTEFARFVNFCKEVVKEWELRNEN